MESERSTGELGLEKPAHLRGVGAGTGLDCGEIVKTKHTLWTWLKDALASARPAPTPRLPQEPRAVIPLDTPPAFSIQELRWA